MNTAKESLGIAKEVRAVQTPPKQIPVPSVKGEKVPNSFAPKQ